MQELPDIEERIRKIALERKAEQEKAGIIETAEKTDSTPEGRIDNIGIPDSPASLQPVGDLYEEAGIERENPNIFTEESISDIIDSYVHQRDDAFLGRIDDPTLQRVLTIADHHVSTEEYVSGQEKPIDMENYSEKKFRSEVRKIF